MPCLFPKPDSPLVTIRGVEALTGPGTLLHEHPVDKTFLSPLLGYLESPAEVLTRFAPHFDHFEQVVEDGQVHLYGVGSPESSTARSSHNNEPPLPEVPVSPPVDAGEGDSSAPDRTCLGQHPFAINTLFGPTRISEYKIAYARVEMEVADETVMLYGYPKED